MTGPSQRQPNAKELSIRGFEITNGGDLDRLNEVFAEDFVMEWPQSHERVVGGANARAIIENYPEGLRRPGARWASPLATRSSSR